MTTLKKLKPCLSFATKSKTRPLLNMAYVDLAGALFATDLETCVRVGNSGLDHGLHDIKTIDLLNSPTNENIEDYPRLFFPQCTNGFSVTIKDLEDFFNYISQDETRIFLNSLAFIDNKIVATNGHVLKAVEVGFANKEGESLLPRNSLKVALSIAKKMKVEKLFFMVDTDCFCVNITEQISVSGRLFPREYPKFQAVIPSKTSGAFTLNELPKFKDIKDLLNPRTFAVKLVGENGIVTLHFPEYPEKTMQVGEYPVENDDFEIGFNYKYLYLFSGQKAEFNNSVSPLKSESGKEIRIVMPLKL